MLTLRVVLLVLLVSLVECRCVLALLLFLSSLNTCHLSHYSGSTCQHLSAPGAHRVSGIDHCILVSGVGPTSLALRHADTYTWCSLVAALNALNTWDTSGLLDGCLMAQVRYDRHDI